MKVLESEEKLCLSCMEKHQVDLVEVTERHIFKGEEIEFKAAYEYCSKADAFLETEEMIKANDLAFKDAYRKKVGLLTSEEIRRIREAYDLSQKDLAVILDWGQATITRYENCQIQDRAHDDVLRTIDADPKWFLDKIISNKNRLSPKAYAKCLQKAKERYNKQQDHYFRNAIHAIYAKFADKATTGGVELNLDKVVEVINYYASKVPHLFKVKLMKMLWYGDALNFKRYDESINGLAYRALPLGAVPEGCDQIIQLDGVNFDVILYDDYEAYRFKPAPGFTVRLLAKHEIETLDTVIRELGSLNTKEIVDKMHQEIAYQKTALYGLISYSWAKDLSLD